MLSQEEVDRIGASYCWKCQEIVTFCECDESITDRDEYISFLEERYESRKTFTDEKIEEVIDELTSHWEWEDWDQKSRGIRWFNTLFPRLLRKLKITD